MIQLIILNIYMVVLDIIIVSINTWEIQECEKDFAITYLKTQIMKYLLVNNTNMI